MVHAPFMLHKVSQRIHTGQASGEHWYLCPFRLWKYRVLAYNGTKQLLTFDYDRSKGQFLGTMLTGKQETWRRA